jgi:predicted PurR-regulated permease PerM
MKVRIDIDTQTFVRFWLVVIGFGIVGFALYSARTALVIIGVALFLALALSNPVNKLAAFMPGKSRFGGTAAAFTLVVAFLGLFIGLIVPPVIEQTIRVADNVPALVDSAQDQWHLVDDLVDRYHLQSQVDNTLNSIKDNATSWAANIGQSFVSSIGSLFNLLAAAFLTIVLAFLMLLEGPSWLRKLWGVYKDQEKMEYHQRLASRMHMVVTGYVTGQLAVSSIGALTAGLVVFVLHFFFPNVPMNLALPTIAIAFIFSLIPMFGATIAGILITILLAFNDVTAAIVFIVFFIVYQQVENNFISPTIQSKTVELSALAVLVAVTIGLYVFGLIGGIISIPIAGCIKVLVEDHFDQTKKARKKSDKPLHKLVKKIQEEA